MRRCIACRESKPQNELLRFTFHDGQLFADTEGRSEGRGYYLCRNNTCVDTAIKKKAFNRVCRCDIDTDKLKRVIEEVFNNN